MSGELCRWGSIPLDTPEDVFRTFGRQLGKYLFAMPDGEGGPRRYWISRMHYQVLAAHLMRVTETAHWLGVAGLGRSHSEVNVRHKTWLCSDSRSSPQR